MIIGVIGLRYSKGAIQFAVGEESKERPQNPIVLMFTGNASNEPILVYLTIEEARILRRMLKRSISSAIYHRGSITTLGELNDTLDKREWEKE